MITAPLVHECPVLTEELKASSTMQTLSLAGVGNVYRHHHQDTPSWLESNDLAGTNRKIRGNPENLRKISKQNNYWMSLKLCHIIRAPVSRL